MRIYFKFNGSLRYVNVLVKAEDFNRINRESSLIKSVKTSGIVLRDDFFNQKVENKIRYILVFENSEWIIKLPNGNICDKFEPEVSDIDLKVSDNNIFFILESPHREEYSDDDKMIPKVPANGKTGEYINKYFISHVLPMLLKLGLKLDTSIKYNFCLINPVPYQASLGNLYKKGLISNIRDVMWKKLFIYTCNEFKKLFDTYKPKIVINACTSEFKRSVQKSINEKASTTMKFSTTHPSSWELNFNNFKKYNSNL